MVLLTDVFRSRPLLCTIHHLINFTLASAENVPVVRAVLDRGHQNNRTRPLAALAAELGQLRPPALRNEIGEAFAYHTDAGDSWTRIYWALRNQDGTLRHSRADYLDDALPKTATFRSLRFPTTAA